jgi:hypothetical protein
MSSLLVGKFHDTVRAVKVHRVIILSVSWCLIAKIWHQGLLSDLSRQCGSLLSMVREHSPQLAGSTAHAEADEIERWAYSIC